MNHSSHRTLPLLVLLICLAAPSVARADRVDRLVAILKRQPDYKVRLQVVLVLTRLRSRRSVPALVQALADPKQTIRGLAAAALAKIGDVSAVTPMAARLAVERDPYVKGELKRALKSLRNLKRGPPRGTRFYITTGKMIDKSGKGGAGAARLMGEVLLRELNKEAAIATDWGGRRPSGAELRKRSIKGFILDGSIVAMERRPSGSTVEVFCKIKVALSTFPGNSMRAFITRGASMMVPASAASPRLAAAQQRDVLEGALVAAKQDLVRTYLSRK